MLGCAPEHQRPSIASRYSPCAMQRAFLLGGRIVSLRRAPSGRMIAGSDTNPGEENVAKRIELTSTVRPQRSRPSRTCRALRLAQ